MDRLVRAAFLAALALVALPAAAAAHGEASPLVRSVIDAVEPNMDGVTFTPVRGPAAQVVVRNTTDEEVAILDDEGRPFLRVGPRGVLGDVDSPVWSASGNPDGRSAPGLRRGRPHRWRLMDRRPRWAYYEHRLHPGQVRLPPEARGAREPVRLQGFVVPLRHGGRAVRVRGHLEFRPIRGRVVPELRSSARPLAGVTVAMLPGEMPAVLLQNTGREAVTVLGLDGEPYARVGPRGVDVNLRSPLHVDDLRTRGEHPPVAADPRARPVWQRVKDVPSYTWHEPRARYPLEQPPDEVVEGERRAVLERWSVPLRSGTRTAALRGDTMWVPTDASGAPVVAAGADQGGGSPLALLLIAGAALASVAGALALRRRAARRLS